MRSDLDALMQQHDLDALLVIGPAFHNPPMVYLTGGAHLTSAELLKPCGQPAMLCCWPMERDEAARTGLQVRQVDQRQHQQDMKETGGDQNQVTARRYARLLQAAGLESGRVGVCGTDDAGKILGVAAALQALLPQLRLVGQEEPSVFHLAMATKDADEISRIRAMGRITAEVIAETADFLTGHRTHNEVLIKTDGEPLTIGDVRRRIGLWLAERNVETPEPTIFAIGRDAGIPHSTGSDGDALRLGSAIVYDIFPCEAGGGYFYDMTRTWSLGYATDETLKVYEDVRAVYEQLRAELRLGAPARQYQLRCCELFEGRGHPTVGTNPNTQSGYVHSLGHGVGLNIHEHPLLGVASPETVTLLPNMVITLEPGLYYPERGLGVRLEDTLWARPDGVFEPLANCPLDLVLPMRPQ